MQCYLPAFVTTSLNCSRSGFLYGADGGFLQLGSDCIQNPSRIRIRDVCLRPRVAVIEAPRRAQLNTTYNLICDKLPPQVQNQKNELPLLVVPLENKHYMPGHCWDVQGCGAGHDASSFQHISNGFSQQPGHSTIRSGDDTATVLREEHCKSYNLAHIQPGLNTNHLVHQVMRVIHIQSGLGGPRRYISFPGHSSRESQDCSEGLVLRPLFGCSIDLYFAVWLQGCT